MPESLTLLSGALAFAAVAAGSAVQAAIGLGLNLFTVPMLALIDPVFVPGPVLFLSFLLSCIASYRLRDDINWSELRLSIGGIAFGTLLGALALAAVSAELLPRLLGVLVIAAVAVTAAGVHVPLSKTSLAGASTLAGITGIVAGMHGPPMALIYLRESPARIRSALLPLFVFANGISLLALAAIGRFGWAEMYATALLLPALFAGYYASPLLIRLLSPGAIRWSLLTISALSGLILALRG
jgi:hypothetical protein